MKIALAQINCTIGDLAGNVKKMLDFARRAAAQGAELVVFPELSITGYSPQDLLENAAFLDGVERALAQLARDLPEGVGAIVGAPVHNRGSVGKRLFNAALLLEDGRQAAVVYKRLLPTYNLYDEYRHFEPAPPQQVVAWRGLRIGLHVCEDMWNAGDGASARLYEPDPVAELAAQGVDLFVNLSALPFSMGKREECAEVITRICRRYGVPFAFANPVGANTSVIYDGNSHVRGADGRVLACAPPFEEALIVWDTDDTEPCDVPPRDDMADLHDALVLGIRDYFAKSPYFTKALIGVSGGLDSALVTALAAEALGPDRVVGVTMPSRYSSGSSVGDALALAENLGIEFHEIAIEPAFNAFEAMLAPFFKDTKMDVTEENIQARARGLTLMALSNKFGYLLLSTGNKSEVAVGYCTLYGDTNGGLAVLSDVYKSEAYRLSRYINERAGREIIPENTITKPPSAELRPDQTDQDSLPPYDVLDPILRLYVEQMRDVEEIVHVTGADAALVRGILSMVDRNEYKRYQLPPGLRVTPRAFGPGRRIPIVMQWKRDGEVARL